MDSLIAANRAANYAGIEIYFCIYDDGSTDGTQEAVNELHMKTKFIEGGGSSYWAKSMAIVESEVLQDTENMDHEYIMWLNDDVILDLDALLLIKKEIDQNSCAIVIGAMRDPTSGNISYSGMIKNGLHPLNYKMVPPGSAESKNIDTFNGNLVIVPIAAARDLGGIDGNYSHALADIDYGIRCKRSNIPIVLASRTLGVCVRDEQITGKNIMEDWVKYRGVKGGGNYRSLKIFLEKNHPRFWFITICASYTLWWARRLVKLITTQPISL